MGNQQQEREMKPIKGFEGKYSVTRDGKVFGHKRNRFLKPKITRYGYATVVLSNKHNKNNAVKHVFVHRLVAGAFVENPDGLTQVNHMDGDKLNNSADNLEWVTPAENIRHSWNNGLSKPSRPNLGRNMDNAKSRYRNVIYMGRTNSFRAIISRIINGKRFTKTKTFNINKYGYEQAELMAAKAVNEFIAKYPEFQDAEPLDIVRVQRPSEESEYTSSEVETAPTLQRKVG